ncbi:hypothetical protein PENTCL1PPCAC_25330, partial [Pristionchus entomophagus]
YCDCGVDKFGFPSGWSYNDIWVDIVVILDTSEALGVDALEEAETLIESFISDGIADFLVTNSNALFYSRLGVISMSDRADVIYNLNMTKADSMQGKVSIKKGVAQINVVDAFEAALLMFNSGSKPERATARQVVYYITDSDAKNDLQYLDEFKASKGVVIVNREVARPALKELASEGYYYLNSDYMQGLQAFCEANCFCKPNKDTYDGADPTIKASG